MLLITIKLGNDDKKLGIKEIIKNSSFSQQIKDNLLKIYSRLGEVVFGNKDIMELLKCSDTTATEYIKKLLELEVIEKVVGKGAGKYMFKIECL